MPATALTARFVFPVGGPPVENGAVVVDGARIVSVGRQTPAGAGVVDLNELHPAGGVAILPGLINAHTHLEFSDFQQPLGQPGMAFPEWIRQVIAHRQEKSQEDDAPSRIRAAIERGIEESIRSGVTAIGEITTHDELLEVYNTSPAYVIAFREFLGLTETAMNKARARAQRVAVASIFTPDRWALGVSPHAPFSTHVALVDLLCELSRSMKIPLAMHLAESRDELDLLATQGGTFRQLLDDLNVWNSAGIPRGGRPLDYLKLLATAHRSLVIHGNYLADDEIAFCGERSDRLSVVYCPRTHAYFNHEPYPLARLLAAGANVALGTDSRASNPDLNLLAEMRHVARHHANISPEVILRLATTDAAKALGLSERVGTLAAGKQADLAVVALPTHEADPYELLLGSDTPTVATFLAGQRFGSDV